MSKSDHVLVKRKVMNVAVSNRSPVMSSPTLSAKSEIDCVELIELALKWLQEVL